MYLSLSWDLKLSLCLSELPLTQILLENHDPMFHRVQPVNTHRHTKLPQSREPCPISSRNTYLSSPLFVQMSVLSLFLN